MVAHWCLSGWITSEGFVSYRICCLVPYSQALHHHMARKCPQIRQEFGWFEMLECRISLAEIILLDHFVKSDLRVQDNEA